MMSSFSSLLLFVSFSAFLSFSSLVSVSAFHKPNVAVTCKSSSWWVLFPLNASIVDRWIPSEFPFMSTADLPSAFSSLPSSHRMVTLEFNKQTDCFASSLPFIKTTFTEFKVQVPFLRSSQFPNRFPLMYKPVIYADNLINAIGGTLQYGLKTVFATPMDYDPNNGLYTVNYDGEQIRGSFSPIGDWFPIDSLSPSSFAHSYLPLHEQTEWLGHDVWGNTRCAKHYYKWDQTRIRWVSGNIRFGEGMVGDSPAFHLNLNGDQQSQLVTAFQIETVHDINALEKCSLIPPGFSIYWKINQDRVFDVAEIKNENGTPLIIWKPTMAENQRFEWVQGEQLKWVGTDKCLDVKDGATVNNNVVFMWECSKRNDNQNQKFVQEGNLIRWKGTNKCLNVIDANNAPGARVGIFECDPNSPSQQFLFK